MADLRHARAGENWYAPCPQRPAGPVPSRPLAPSCDVTSLLCFFRGPCSRAALGTGTAAIRPRVLLVLATLRAHPAGERARSRAPRRGLLGGVGRGGRPTPRPLDPAPPRWPPPPACTSARTRSPSRLPRWPAPPCRRARRRRRRPGPRGPSAATRPPSAPLAAHDGSWDRRSRSPAPEASTGGRPSSGARSAGGRPGSRRAALLRSWERADLDRGTAQPEDMPPLSARR